MIDAIVYSLSPECHARFGWLRGVSTVLGIRAGLVHHLTALLPTKRENLPLRDLERSQLNWVSLQPSSMSLQPSSFSLEASSMSLEPSSSSLQPSSFSLEASSMSLQPSSFSL